MGDEPVKEVLVKKLLSIGVVLALLVTFIVPVAVGAQDDRCEYQPPDCPELPAKTTKSLAGAAVWTTLAATDIMGTAVAQTTGMLACNLGGWSDELGIIATQGVGVLLEGIGDLLPSLGDLIGVEALNPILDALGNMLKSLAEVLADFDGNG